ncbi:hypothetical protein Bca52824_088030 [Brassica carinata]|uniref:Uncharacterized protein n=1 Tax=Brassica carinata TaxID=52824 RepID=A0A8X7TNG9_BRACI|nr:hypothetical protein Bca52824_088030 [Brassica carinata]
MIVYYVSTQKRTQKYRLSHFNSCDAHQHISIDLFNMEKGRKKKKPQLLLIYSINKEYKKKKGWTLVRYQKSTRCAEKSGTGDDLGGQYKEKLPIRIKFPSPSRLGRIPTVSLARAVVYSTRSSAMITTEIMIDDNRRGMILNVLEFFFQSYY